MTFAAILSAALWLCLAVPDDHATLVITGARVWTGNPGQPWADAVAVRDDRVLAVGAEAEVRKLISNTTRLIDANGRMLEEALSAYTCDAAYAAFDEKEKGTLQTGKLADMVLIDRDLTRVPARELREARIDLTVIGGQVVYERKRLTGSGWPDLR